MIANLKRIINCTCVSGHEKNVMQMLEDLIKPYVDECKTDAMGNLICVKKGKEASPSVMLCAHADEIGFIVTYIEDNGFIRIAPIGGIRFWSTVCSEVLFENGTVGVLVPESGVKPEDVTFDKCMVDIGAKNKKEAEKYVKIGDTLAVKPQLIHLKGSRYAGRPMDDRIGCAVILDIARQLHENGTDATVYYVFSVQEEVGCRGARPAAFNVGADYGLAFDVTGIGDVPGSTPMACALGDGAAVKIKDSSVICHVDVVDMLIRLAKENKIKYQTEVLLAGGTDTSSMQSAGFGMKAGALSIPTRYIHSAVETFDLKDAQACADLAAHFCRKIQ